MKQLALQANWIHPPDVEKWLAKMAVGRTLNICCGMSKVGDVRVDIDPNTNRTEECDMFNLHFEPLSFDTVIIDPPFKYYVTGDNRFRWIRTVRAIARKRILISTDKVNPTNFLLCRQVEYQTFRVGERHSLC